MNDQQLVQHVIEQLHRERELYRSILAKTDDDIRRLRGGAAVDEIQASLDDKKVLLDQVPASLTRRQELLSAWADALPQLPIATVAAARELQREVVSTMQLALERMDELSSLVAAAIKSSRGAEETMVRQKQASQAYQRNNSPDPRFIDRKR